MTTTQPAPLPLDDLHRINDALDRIALTGLVEQVTVQITGPAEPEPCTECGDPGDLTVHWGYAQACYADWLCYSHLRRFLGIRVRHDKARPVVDIPAAVLS